MPLLRESEGFIGYLAVAIDNFADPNFPAPTIAVWEESRHPWVSLPPAACRFSSGGARQAEKRQNVTAITIESIRPCHECYLEASGSCARPAQKSFKRAFIADEAWGKEK